MIQFSRVARRLAASNLSRQALIFAFLKHRMKIDGLMYGEGTLESLPDGFGHKTMGNTCLLPVVSTAASTTISMPWSGSTSRS